MIANFFSSLAAKVLGATSLALLIACAVLWASTSHYKHKFENEHIARENDRKAYELAAKEAEAKAIAAKLATEATYRAKAEEADNDYQTMLARARRAADAYAQRMRAQVARGASGNPASPAPGNSPEGPDGPRADAVVVGRDDFDILVENSVRLKAAHDWAKTLNVEPIPDPAF